LTKMYGLVKYPYAQYFPVDLMDLLFNQEKKFCNSTLADLETSYHLLTSIATFSHEIVYCTNIASDLKNASQYQKGDTSFMVDN
jgi:hypothetical protein